jgi:large subunit ribosomal protein L25
MTTGKTKRPTLPVEKRTLLGRKVKKLRQEGKLPANIYGKNIKSQAVVTDSAQVNKIFSQVGETGLVDLKLKGEKKVRPVLLHNPQYDPITDQLIHIDFYQVDLKQKVSTEVPIRIIGTAPAAEKGEGVLVQVANDVEVEALPTELPEYFEVDVSSLEKVDEAILVKDLKAPKAVEIKANPDQVIVKIEPLQEEEELPPPTEEAEEAEGAEKAPEGEGKEAGAEQPKPEGETKQPETEETETPPAKEEKK